MSRPTRARSQQPTSSRTETPIAGDEPGLVVDASVMVAALADVGHDGEWARPVLSRTWIAAPQLAAWETANILRRRELAGQLLPRSSEAAHLEMLTMPVDWWPYRPLAGRAWQLRHNASMYDATYVALAELLSVPLVTLDRRLARTPGLRCEVLTPLRDQ